MTWAERELKRLSAIEYSEDWTEDDYEAYAYVKCVNAESEWLDAQDESDAEMDWQNWEVLQEVRF